MWNAPEAMNRIWSVLSGPYLVATVVPSISGSRSRWTPSRLTDPPRTSLTAILSISSRKTMPLASASASATRLTSSGSMRLSASSSVSRAKASGTLSLRRLRAAAGRAPCPSSTSRSNTCAPMPGMSNGIAGASSTSISTSAVSRLPSAKRWRKLARVASLDPLPVSASSSRSIAASSAAVADRLAAPLALQPDRFLDQVAGDLLDVAADIADLGELGRLDLDERRVGELRQPPADLGLAAAGRPDHQDVLGRHFLAQLGRQLLPPPAVAQAPPRPLSWRRPGRRYARPARRRSPWG